MACKIKCLTAACQAWTGNKLERKRSLLIAGIITAVILGIGSVAAYSYSLSKRIPSEDELPDKTILDDQKELAEVKAFLTKYPNATIFVDRSGRLAVDYWTDKKLSDDSDDVRTLRLRVFSDNEGRPQEVYIDCPDGKNAHLIYKDIVNYIENESCWTTPYYV